METPNSAIFYSTFVLLALMTVCKYFLHYVSLMKFWEMKRSCGIKVLNFSIWKVWKMISESVWGPCFRRQVTFTDWTSSPAHPSNGVCRYAWSLRSLWLKSIFSFRFNELLQNGRFFHDSGIAGESGRSCKRHLKVLAQASARGTPSCAHNAPSDFHKVFEFTDGGAREGVCARNEEHVKVSRSSILTVFPRGTIYFC